MRFLLLTLFAGCATGGGRWDDVPIERAWLERFDLSSIGAVVGGVGGDAVLGFEEPGGVVGGVPVHLGGGTLGLVFDFSGDFEGHDGSVDLDLSDVESPTVGDVFGTYHGSTASAAAGIGASGRRMRNGQGASFREDHFQVGIGLHVGYEWIVIRPGGSEGEDRTDGFDATGDSDTEGAPTGTGDTGAPTTPTPTTPPTTTPTGTATPPTTGTTGTTTGTGGDGADGCGGDGGGCGGGDGSGCGCDDDSGCACAHGSVAPIGAIWVGVLLRRRRRR